MLKVSSYSVVGPLSRRRQARGPRLVVFFALCALPNMMDRFSAPTSTLCSVLTLRGQMDFRAIRLSRDLRFVEKNPVDGAACEPVDGDELRVWHGNVLLGSGDDEAAYHFVITFPDTYPVAAPSVRFATPVPHPNVLANGIFCTELLGNSQWAVDALPGAFSGWSSAYSPFAVLLSLVSMRDELLDNHNGVGPGEGAARARNHSCQQCGHRKGHEWPSIEEAGRLKTVEVFVPPPVTLLVPVEPVIKRVATVAATVKAPAPVAKAVAAAAVPAAKAAASPAVQTAAPVTKLSKPAVKQQIKAKKESAWVVVGPKKTAATVQKKAAPQQQQKKPLQQQQAMAKAVGAPSSNKASKQANTEVEYVPVGWMDEKAEKKRAERQKRRMREKAKLAAQMEAERVAAEKKAKKAAEKRKAAKLAKAVAPIAKTVASAAVTIVEAPATTLAVSSSKKQGAVVMGAFAKTPADVIAYLLRFLPLHDVLRCAQLCRGFAKVARNAFLWRDLYAREFPLSSPSQFGDFRHVYTLRVQGIVSELVCFHTKASLMESEEVILGYGINFTKNPKTNRLDYVDVTSELMSSEAFYTLKVRRGPRGEEVKAFLPCYLTAEHFGRSKMPALFKRVASELCPDEQLEEGLVRVLCCALNTRSVLLADKGVGNADTSFAVYSQLQRLFLALAAELPYIQRTVEDRVHSFVISERNREKDSTPSLGEFIPLLLVSKRYSWAQVRPMLLREVLARNVLWAGRHNSALANNESAMPASQRCAKFWSGTVVSNRLMMLSALFLSMSRREGSLAEQARVLDRLYGRQPLKTLATIKRVTAAILAPDAAWPMYFRVLLGASLPEARVEALLKDAVRDSRKKGYHSARTNFSAVMASGTSKILRKGESYTTAKDVNEIMLSLGWYFPRDVIFLDASLLCFNQSGTFIKGSQLDYQSPVNNVLGEAAMHSGDVITEEQKKGEHCIRISLHKMPKAVTSMYFTLSAWTQDLVSTLCCSCLIAFLTSYPLRSRRL